MCQLCPSEGFVIYSHTAHVFRDAAVDSYESRLYMRMIYIVTSLTLSPRCLELGMSCEDLYPSKMQIDTTIDINMLKGMAKQICH